MRRLNRVALLVVACATAASFGVWRASVREPSIGQVATPIDRTPDPGPVTSVVESPAPGSPGPDVLSAYAAMRDDVNPKPRLQLIDEWARHRKAEDGLDLLTQAMVDPDESVRERAQVLFDGQMALAPSMRSPRPSLDMSRN